MAWELNINGSTVSVLSGDSIRVNYQRDVNIMTIPMSDEEWAMDMITTKKVIRISGLVADGEDGKTLTQWFNEFISLLPSSTFDNSNYLRIKDSDGNIIKEYTPVVLESIDINIDSKDPTILNYNLQVTVVSEVY